MNGMTLSVRPAHQRGFGLVEIMIASVISLLLLGGVIGIFINNKQNSRLQQNLARIQENARYAMNVLTQDIRMAGYSGCNPNIIDHLDPAGTGYSDALFNIKTAVSGWEYSNGTGTGPGQTYNITSLDPASTGVNEWDDAGGNDLYVDLNQRVVPGTDIIVTKYLGDALSVSLANGNNINANTLLTNAPVTGTGIASSTILLVTEDCTNADLFMKQNNASASSVTKGGGVNPGNVNANTIPGFSGGQKWSTTYTSSASLLTFQSAVYYIGEGASGLPALWRATYNAGPIGVHQELVDGIENMQVLYGEDTDSPLDGVANRYRTINNVTDPLNIVAVRISMLLRAPQEVHNLTTDTATYLLTGLTNATATEINPADDKRLRVVATATIKLRNKGSNL